MDSEKLKLRKEMCGILKRIVSGEFVKTDNSFTKTGIDSLDSKLEHFIEVNFLSKKF